MPMIAITTSNSTRVNAVGLRGFMIVSSPQDWILRFSWFVARGGFGPLEIRQQLRSEGRRYLGARSLEFAPVQYRCCRGPRPVRTRLLRCRPGRQRAVRGHVLDRLRLVARLGCGTTAWIAGRVRARVIVPTGQRAPS